MVDTPPQTDTYSTALDIFDRTHPLRVDVDENLKVVGTVTVVPSGTQNVSVVSSVPLAVTEANVDKNFGTWAYSAGTAGTVVVSAGRRVIGIGVYSTAGGSFTINGGNSVPIPAGVSINVNPLGNLTAPTIIFTSTDSYFVETVV